MAEQDLMGSAGQEGKKATTLMYAHGLYVADLALPVYHGAVAQSGQPRRRQPGPASMRFVVNEQSSFAVSSSLITRDQYSGLRVSS